MFRRVVVLVAVAAFCATDVCAIGVCEIAKPTIEPMGFSKKYLQFAVKRTIEFCIEDIGGPDGPTPLVWSFVDVHKIDGSVKRRFSYEVDRKVLDKLRSDPRAKDNLPTELHPYVTEPLLSREKIDAHLGDGSFLAVEASKKSPNRKCKVRALVLTREDAPIEAKQFVIMLGGGDKSKQRKLLDSQRSYTGDLEFRFRWYKIPRKGRRKHANAIGFTLVQKNGWAPGAPGSVHSAEFHILRSEALAGCF